MLKKLTALLCALLMVFAVAAADSGLPTPDYAATHKDFIGAWAVYQGYMDGEWIDPAVSGAGVIITESEVSFHEHGTVMFTFPYEYADGRLLFSPEGDDGTIFFGTDGMLYMHDLSSDIHISFGRDLTVDAPEAADENPFVGEWEAAIVIMIGEPLLPSDLGFELGMIVTETEASTTSAGQVMATETYFIEDGIAYLGDNLTVMFFDDYGLLHVQDSQIDMICVPADRESPF